MDIQKLLFLPELASAHGGVAISGGVRPRNNPDDIGTCQGGHDGALRPKEFTLGGDGRRAGRLEIACESLTLPERRLAFLLAVSQEACARQMVLVICPYNPVSKNQTMEEASRTV